MKFGQHQGANNDAKIYVGRSTTVHNLLFFAHTLCMNYVTNTFLLVSSSVRRKQLLCFVHAIAVIACVADETKPRYSPSANQRPKAYSAPRVVPGFSIIGSNWLLHMAVLSCIVIGRVDPRGAMVTLSMNTRYSTQTQR